MHPTVSLWWPPGRGNLLPLGLTVDSGSEVRRQRRGGAQAGTLATRLLRAGTKEEKKILPDVWTREENHRGLNIPPIHTELKDKRETEDNILHPWKGDSDENLL